MTSSQTWQLDLLRVAGEQGVSPNSGVHLAILIEPFFSRLVDGTKTIESRWGNTRIAPHGGCVHLGDSVFIKRSGGAPVWGYFEAGKIYEYRDITPSFIDVLRETFGAMLGLDEPSDAFWSERSCKKFATFIEVRNVRQLELPLKLSKKDRRGWVTLRMRQGVTGADGSGTKQPPSVGGVRMRQRPRAAGGVLSSPHQHETRGARMNCPRCLSTGYVLRPMQELETQPCPECSLMNRCEPAKWKWGPEWLLLPPPDGISQEQWEDWNLERAWPICIASTVTASCVP
jgi:predicted RNA-binding Zn-ribbon protein involved in translation (DUF1610 family)